jgi:regulator of sirC expression with transglutaminase-like and TPR domain
MRPDAEIPLDEAALCIAAERYPGLNVGAYLARLDLLADGARCGVERASTDAQRVAALNRYLFREEGFGGNHEDYDDPRNSFLNEVLDRRTGIPISLTVVYVEVARRLRMPVRGVGFPGHFLAKYVARPEILIDPFHGHVIGEAECAARLRALAGDDVSFDRRLLDPTSKREILARMLRNLKLRYVATGELERALACSERIVLLRPDAADELRDRGLLFLRLECFQPALADLERYVDLDPRDPAAPAIRERLPELRRQVAGIH